MRRYLCLFFPYWPIQCLRLERPETVGRPSALFERTAYGPVVVACSGEAGRLGIRAGMSAADARALAPELLLFEADFAAYQTRLEALCLWCIRFSPLTGVESPGPHAVHPQALFLDTTGCEQVFHGEENLVRQAVTDLRKQGFDVRAAMASTLGTAWARAHYGTNLTWVQHKGSSVGKSETEPGVCSAANPSPLTPLPQGERGTGRVPLPLQGERGTDLEPLPLPALRLDSETLDYLYSLGLERIGELLRQPRSALPSRFGPALIERIDQALGVVPERLATLLPPPEFRVAWAFDYPVRSTEILLPIVERMVAALAAELQAAGRGARQLECWLFHEIAAPVRVELTLHRGSSQQKHLCQLLRAKMEDTLRSPHSALLKSRRARKSGARKSFSIEVEACERMLDVEEGVCAVALQVLSSEALRELQLSLFERNAEEAASGGLGLLLDRLATRLGAGTVLRARLEDAILPEQGFRVITLGNSGQGDTETRRR